MSSFRIVVLSVWLLIVTVAAAGSPSRVLVASVSNGDVQTLLKELLEVNPELNAARAAARAQEEQVPQVKSLPDPMIGFTAFLLAPETRVGPQRLTASVSQVFPWFGKLKLKEQTALWEATASRAKVDALELSLVTQARVLLLEYSFLNARADLIREDGEILTHFEELARARYTSGMGIQSTIVKIQAEITRTEQKLLDLKQQQVRLAARINQLLNRLPDTEIPLLHVQDAPDGWKEMDLDTLRNTAFTTRPEILESLSLMEAGKTRIKLAEKDFWPNVTAGLTYTMVDHRNDADPEDNGRDILGISAGINLPIQRERREAAVREAVQKQIGAEHRLSSVRNDIEASLGDLHARLPLLKRQVRLFNDVLLIQADESLNSALAAYSAGTVGVMDLLDAERILLEVRTAFLRTRTDYLADLIRLEGTIGTPLYSLPEGGVRNEK